MPARLTIPDLSYRRTVLSDSPILYMRLGETSGPATDEVGTYTGTYLGALSRGEPSLIQNNEGDLSCRFAGTTHRIDLDIGSPFTFPAGGDTPAQTPFSIECWYSNWAQGSFAVLFMQYDSGGIGWYNAGLLLRGTGAYFNKDDPTGGELDSLFGGDAGLHHVVYTENLGASRRSIFVDGVLRASDNSPTTWAGGTTLDMVSIGNRSNGPRPASDALTIDEVAVYDYELSAGRVLVHYQVGTGTF